jgi:hypothetical protein
MRTESAIPLSFCKYFELMGCFGLGEHGMVGVFIAHHPNDKVIAESLRLNLESRGIASQLGHTAQEGWSLGESAKYVLIIWSQNSVLSPHIYEIAVTFPNFRLGHLAVSGLKLDDIPEPVRPDKLTLVTSYATIADAISRRAKQDALPLPMYSLRLDALEEDGSEAARRKARAKLHEKVLRTAAGKLVHKIPSSMTRNVEEVIEVRLGRLQAQGLLTGLAGQGSLVHEDLHIVETMTVMLHSRAGAFLIKEETRPTQLVNGDRFNDSRFEDFGKWTWRVTPKRLGTHELHINVSAELLDSQGIPASAALPIRTFTVRVRVNYPQLSFQAMGWGASGVFGALFAGVVGAYTQDIWWPTIKVWMQSFGLLE